MRPASAESGHLLGDQDVLTVAAYRAAGGGNGLSRAHEIGPSATIDTIVDARLRGRGGGGFPTGLKWRGIAEAPDDQRRFLVCNAAEGEPGTFKDRALIRANPFQLLEGIAIAASAIGAETAYIGIKEKYHEEISRLEAAATEMNDAGMLGDIPINVVTGPDDYLLGEETGLLEAIEGRQPLPRWLPPYVHGLHVGSAPGVGAGTSGWDTHYNPTVVNNVETLANVPHILTRGSEWFRSIGTEDAPGTMVFTISGDVLNETVVELPMGTPLAVLIYGIGGGLAEGRRIAAVFPGAANSPIPDRLLDVPMDYQSMRAIGSGLGSGGMIAYDDTACVIAATAALSRFQAIESCGQCPPCKLGTAAITARLDLIESDAGTRLTVDEVQAWLSRVTDANRCGLGAGERALVAGLFSWFDEDIAEHLESGCHSSRRVRIPKIVDRVRHENRFIYDDTYLEWRNR